MSGRVDSGVGSSVDGWVVAAGVNVASLTIGVGDAVGESEGDSTGTVQAVIRMSSRTVARLRNMAVIMTHEQKIGNLIASQSSSPLDFELFMRKVTIMPP